MHMLTFLQKNTLTDGILLISRLPTVKVCMYKKRCDRNKKCITYNGVALVRLEKPRGSFFTTKQKTT